jgi:hypothetical protein
MMAPAKSMSCTMVESGTRHASQSRKSVTQVHYSVSAFPIVAILIRYSIYISFTLEASVLTTPACLEQSKVSASEAQGDNQPVLLMAVVVVLRHYASPVSVSFMRCHFKTHLPAVLRVVFQLHVSGICSIFEPVYFISSVMFQCSHDVSTYIHQP